jgi:hypothetical protein
MPTLDVEKKKNNVVVSKANNVIEIAEHKNVVHVSGGISVLIEKKEVVVQINKCSDVAVVKETKTNVVEVSPPFVKPPIIEAENVGTGAEVYKDIIDKTLRFRTITGSGEAEVTQEDDEVNIHVSSPDLSGYATLNEFDRLTQSENPQPVDITTYYVASSFTVFGTRDGSRDYPFSTLQEAGDAIGVPTNQAEYLRQYNIIILDSGVYAGITLSTGRITVNFSNATIIGDIRWQVTNTERFGSTAAPFLNLVKDQATIQSGITGNVIVERKTGGTVIPTGTVRIIGQLHNGTTTIADGTNGGLTAFNTGVLSYVDTGITGTGQIFARTTLVGFRNSSYNPNLPIEVGAISLVTNSVISSLDIAEYTNTTAVRNIRNLTLNATGGVTYRAINSARNWNVDVVSGSEILTKITSFPNNALNLILPVAGAVRIQDAGGYFTPPLDVENALQELANFVGL